LCDFRACADQFGIGLSQLIRLWSFAVSTFSSTQPPKHVLSAVEWARFVTSFSQKQSFNIPIVISPIFSFSKGLFCFIVRPNSDAWQFAGRQNVKRDFRVPVLDFRFQLVNRQSQIVKK
jgi:hypothetical protein